MSRLSGFLAQKKTDKNTEETAQWCDENILCWRETTLSPAFKGKMISPLFPRNAASRIGLYRMISNQRLQSYIENYAEVFGTRTNTFVCPITLKECQPCELIEGHILNRGFAKASRRTVVQYGSIDHFYGATVEPTLVEYANLKTRSERGLIKDSRELQVEFADGSTAQAFEATTPAGRFAGKKFPRVTLALESGDEYDVYVKCGHDDTRLDSAMQLWARAGTFAPAHWVAAMLKAGYLAMFDLMGYRAVLNPFGDTLRRSLAAFYTERACRDDAALFFDDFRNAVKFGGMGDSESDLRINYRRFNFDSLDDQILVFHYTPGETLFAATCVFHINDITTGVVLPTTLTGGDVVTAWEFYSRLMAGEADLPSTHFLVKFDGDMIRQWERPVQMTYVSQR